jgi:AcrR family transcriptional regulator
MYASKKAEVAARTRAALEDVARELFEARGFGEVSAEEIVAAAGVTRGALYHHFGGKEGLFEAVAEAAMRRLHANIANAASGAIDPLGALKLGMQRFLELTTAPRLQRVLFVDAPAVLGWRRWRELDERYGFGLLKQAIDLAMAAGQLRPRSNELVAHILLSAMIEAAMLIANSPRKAELRDEAQAMLARLIDGFA